VTAAGTRYRRWAAYGGCQLLFASLSAGSTAQAALISRLSPGTLPPAAARRAAHGTISGDGDVPVPQSARGADCESVRSVCATAPSWAAATTSVPMALGRCAAPTGTVERRSQDRRSPNCGDFEQLTGVRYVASFLRPPIDPRSLGGQHFRCRARRFTPRQVAFSLPRRGFRRHAVLLLSRRRVGHGRRATAGRAERRWRRVQHPPSMQPTQPASPLSAMRHQRGGPHPVLRGRGESRPDHLTRPHPLRAADVALRWACSARAGHLRSAHAHRRRSPGNIRTP
jgi:hypothetical protein